MTRSRKILIIDDEPEVVSWLVDSLVEEGFVATGETSARRALERITASSFDLVISDVEMPELRGPELMRAIQTARSSQMVMLISAFGSIDMAVESVRCGAVDFLAKPFRIEALLLSIERALRERQMHREIVRLRAVANREMPSGIATRSSVMQAVLDLAARSARSDLPVLITGESGVGKGALARYVHEASTRKAQKFIGINCAALPFNLVEAELFGVRRGAFTDAREDRPGVFEQAHQGTLFLDEIGELSLEVQPKLLQALESNHVRPLGSNRNVPADARIVAATNRPLEEALRERRFRPDLYHRLNVIRIEIPPLRDRPEDIDAIVDQVLPNLGRRSRGGLVGISLEALRWLRVQAWPGNVRELINALERAAALAENDVLMLEDFTSTPAPLDGDFLSSALEQELSIEDLEKAYIRRILLKTQGHKGRAAQILGLDRRTLYRKVAEFESSSEDADAKDNDEGGSQGPGR